MLQPPGRAAKVMYQIDFTAVASGKRVASSKRRVRWRFGQANSEALAQGLTGTACRGQEYDVTLVWSVTSGKRLLMVNGQEVHYSNSRENVFNFSWTLLPGNLTARVIAHTNPPTSETQSQYDLLIHGVSFFTFPKVYRLGLSSDDGDKALIKPAPSLQQQQQQQQQQNHATGYSFDYDAVFGPSKSNDDGRQNEKTKPAPSLQQLQEPTKAAIADGTAVRVQCTNCLNWIQVPRSATLMYCPICTVVSPVDQTSAKPNSAVQMTADQQLAEKLGGGGREGADQDGDDADLLEAIRLSLKDNPPKKIESPAATSLIDMITPEQEDGYIREAIKQSLQENTTASSSGGSSEPQNDLTNFFSADVGATFTKQQQKEAEKVPVVVEKVLNLRQLGIAESSIKHGLTTIESDKWIVSVEPTQVRIIDLQDGAKVTTRPIQANFAVMNPEQNIIALRKGTKVQIFDLDIKAKLKSYDMPESVVFWKWTSASNLALITPTAVYHWSLDDTSLYPAFVFTRQGPECQINNYRVSPDNDWCLIGGISAGAGGVVHGNMQLFSVEQNVSQQLEGHAAAFATMNLADRENPATCLVFQERKAENPEGNDKLFVVELHTRSNTGARFSLPPSQIPMAPGASRDFPVSLEIDPKHDLAFMVTKKGYLYMFDIRSGKTVCRSRITQDSVYVTSVQKSTGAIFCITVRKGQVFRIQLNSRAVVPYVTSTLRDDNLARSLAARLPKKPFNFDGHKVESREELDVIHQSLETKHHTATSKAEATGFSETDITMLETLSSKLDEIESAMRDSGLSLPVMKDMNEELANIKSDQSKAARARNTSLLRSLATKKDGLVAKLQRAKQAFDRRVASLQVPAPAPAPIKPSGLAPAASSSSVGGQHHGSRSIIKTAMEATSPLLSVAEVSFEYLSVVTQDWSDGSLLGSGGQGAVYRGYDSKLNCAMAIKRIPIEHLNQRSAYDREIMALCRLNHPNVVRLLARCDQDRFFSFLVFEYAAGGTLTEALKERDSVATFTWKRRMDTIVALVHALQHCHHHGIKHRDVKPDNICFLDEAYRQLLLIDFGIATDAESTMTSFGGTQVYMAQEYLYNRKYFAEPQEVYSIGVVIIALITAKTTTTELSQIKESVARDGPNILLRIPDAAAGAWDRDVLGEASRLASLCVATDPRRRPSFVQLLDALSRMKPKFATALTQSQTTALQHELSASVLGSTTVAEVGKKCGCGRIAFDGLQCRNGHAVCKHCLEEVVKGQISSDSIKCHIGSCHAAFALADLRMHVDAEILAEHALARQRAHWAHHRHEKVNNELRHLKEVMLRQMKSSLDQQRAMIAAGIGHLASDRAKCPSLVVLWPCRPRRRFYQQPFCKVYNMYFLCAFDRTPTVSSILVVKRRGWVRKVLPVLKYSLMAMKLLGTVYGFVPLPNCIPGIGAEQQMASLVESLSDVLGAEDYSEWVAGLDEIGRGQMDEGTLRRLLCHNAQTIDSEVHSAVSKLANKPGNLSWKDEMEFRSNSRGDAAWVKKSNVDRWTREGTGGMIGFTNSVTPAPRMIGFANAVSPASTSQRHPYQKQQMYGQSPNNDLKLFSGATTSASDGHSVPKQKMNPFDLY